MQKLSMNDASFLFMDRKETPNHIGGLVIIEPEDNDTPFYDKYRAMIAGRIAEVPLMRWKLAEAPLDLDLPQWIEQDDLDLDYHVRSTAVARPGTMQQLWDKVCRLHSQPLDKSRPLWEQYVIDGLEGGKVALYFKIHHSCMDGQMGVQMQTVLFDLTPEPRDPLTPEQIKEMRLDRVAAKKAPSLLDAAMGGLKSAYDNRLTLKSLGQIAKAARAAIDKKDELEKSIPPTIPRTRFNAPISDQRAFAAASLSLAEMKAVKNAAGVTLNDVAVAAVGGALRRYLEEKNALPDQTLICGTPVALPQKDDSANNVGFMMMSFASDIADPKKRLQVVHESSTNAKAGQKALTELGDMMPTMYTPPALARPLTKLFSSPSVMGMAPVGINAVLSNVPGVPFQLYIAGAKVLANYPMSVLLHGQGLNITATSYMDSMDFGVICCRQQANDPDRLLAHLQDEFEAMKAAVLETTETEETPAETRKDNVTKFSKVA
ncbi:MAG: WS/DGAT/MGAT family O-acyltransferase [Alphaproteobacteria bacterium]